MAGLPSLDDCRPGIRATGFNLVVAVEAAEEKIGKIIMPDNVRDKNQIVQQRGRIVSVGPVAFDFAAFPDGEAPKPGDAILYAKLAGFRTDGTDGREYRVIQDRDVAAIIDEATEPEAAYKSFNLGWREGQGFFKEEAQ